MVEPLSLGSAAIMAGGSLLSGALGASSSRTQTARNRREARRQFDAQMDFNKNATQYRVADAIRAGVNPLAALGVSSNVSPTMHTGGTDDSGAIMANAASRATDAFARVLNREAVDNARESAALDIEGKRLQNEYMQAQIDNARNPGYLTNHEDNSVMSRDTRPENLFRVVYDVNGDPRMVVDQDITENDTDNPGYLSALKNMLGSSQIIRSTGHVRSRQLRMMIDDMYYQATGRHIKNLDRLYFPMSEALLAAIDKFRGN